MTMMGRYNNSHSPGHAKTTSSGQCILQTYTKIHGIGVINKFKN